MGAVRSALSRRVSEIVGVALFASALLWLVALGSYEPSDPVWFFSTGTEAPANFAGRVGAFIAELSFQVLGYGSYLLPVVVVVAGWHYFWCRVVDAVYTKAFGATLVLASASAFLSLVLGRVDAGDYSFRAGGYLGEFLAGVLSDYLSRTGSIIVILTLLFVAVILSTQFSFGRLFRTIFGLVARTIQASGGAAKRWRDDRRRERQRREVIAKHVKRGTPPEMVKAAVERAARPDQAAGRARIAARAGDDETDDHTDEVAAMRRPAGFRVTPPVVQKRARLPIAPSLPLPEPEPLRGPAERRMSGYTLPPSSLLDPPKAERKVDERELMEAARLLEEKCREFSVEGAVVQIHPGPVVTTFEFKPDAGVKYSKVTGLADDLCLAMQAESVLIERIPGKSTVGIQIPNPNREPISLRELLESDTYQRSASKLTLALGKTIHGEPYMMDLAMMPHLLIAGSTGTGKSVGLNSMLTSILFRATPDDVRMIMIDPKRLELGMYEEIPHLMTPVVVDPKKASNALRWAVREMEDRYKTLAAFGVRNIEQYNRNVRQFIEAKELPDGATEMPRVLPFIVVVVDELADLMMVAGNEVEESIARLAQMARAVGIHLILATQRPSVDVITGLIKANLPTRISFRVASKIDSRTILDSNGAEQLLGRGDMLLLPPASSQKVRLHGPYISEQESARLASFLRKQGKPIYDESITADDKKSGPEAIEFEKDDLYDEAARIVVETGQVSISYLQRKLRIGFSRAARLVDMMEAEGLISPATGGKPREVLVGRNYFEEVDAQLR
ncbi:MAG TPA: DNA translocase FtsK 4TM domain-containing protein [Vicinamibacterales bacterium]|nr:DNA translocase FtsK 4TM domain-containing protein [Vicinamibacterales bacterium]